MGRPGASGPPTVRDLYGSGAIEQGSDTILLLDRPHLYDRAARSSEANVLVGKNKDGEWWIVKMEFDGGRQRFREVA